MLGRLRDPVHRQQCSRACACRASKRSVFSRDDVCLAWPLVPPPPSQKWNKGKVREKLANAVLFDDKTYERLVAEVPKVRPAAAAVHSTVAV